MKETNLKIEDLAIFLKWVSNVTYKQDGKYVYKEMGIFTNELELAEIFIETKNEYEYFKKIINKRNK